MDLPTIANTLGRVEEKIDNALKLVIEQQAASALAHERIDRTEKWQARATGALTTWGVVFAAFVAWVKAHVGRA